jgi:hypothetical protein
MSTRFQITVKRTDATAATEWEYTYKLDADKASLEELEAHLRTVLVLLDSQAQSGCDDEDES